MSRNISVVTRAQKLADDKCINDSDVDCIPIIDDVNVCSSKKRSHDEESEKESSVEMDEESVLQGVDETSPYVVSVDEENLEVDGRVPGREAGTNPSASINEDLVPGKGTDECKELVEFTENLLPVGIGNDKVQYIDQLKADKSLDTIR